MEAAPAATVEKTSHIDRLLHRHARQIRLELALLSCFALALVVPKSACVGFIARCLSLTNTLLHGKTAKIELLQTTFLQGIEGLRDRETFML